MAPISPKAQEAADRFFQWARAKAANNPRDPLEPKAEVVRVRDRDGRFSGPRRDVEDVPRLPIFPLRWVLDDPRQRPYFVFWASEDGDLRYGLKMAPAEHANAVLVTLGSGETYRIAIVRRALPRGTGTVLFYRCLSCRRPRRYLYLLTRVGSRLVEYLGLQCQACARLRFASQGRYIDRFSRGVFAPFLEGRRKTLPLPRQPWDPQAVSDPRLGLGEDDPDAADGVDKPEPREASDRGPEGPRTRARRSVEQTVQDGRPARERPDEHRRLVLTKANSFKGRALEPARKIRGDAKTVTDQSPTHVLAAKLVQGLFLPPGEAFPYFKLFIEHGLGHPRRHS